MNCVLRYRSAGVATMAMFIAIVLACSFPRIFAQGSGDSILLGLVSSSRGGFELRATKNQLLATPQWTGWPSEPPLSLEKAHDIVLKWLQKQGVKKAAADIIEWRKILEVENRWCYSFTFDPGKDKKFVSDPINPVIVLMDGTVLEPKRPNPFLR